MIEAKNLELAKSISKKIVSLMKEKFEKKSVLLIAGSDSSAGAGSSWYKDFNFFKVYAATVFTALTAQNTKGVNKVLNIPIHFIEEQIKAIAQDLDISYIKIGMLSNKNIIKLLIIL